MPPIVVVIGLSLAGTAAKDATINSAIGHYDLRLLGMIINKRNLEVWQTKPVCMRNWGKIHNTYDLRFFAVAMLTMAITVIFNMYFKGFLGLIPIIKAIIGTTNEKLDPI